MEGPEESSRGWLLWDGACGFCCWWVEWARRRGVEERLRVIAYQDAPDPPMNAKLRLHAARSVQVILPNGTILEGGRACLAVLALVGREREARWLSRRPFVWKVEGIYRIVAGTRGFWGRWISRPPERCRRESSLPPHKSC